MSIILLLLLEIRYVFLQVGYVNECLLEASGQGAVAGDQSGISGGEVGHFELVGPAEFIKGLIHHGLNVLGLVELIAHGLGYTCLLLPVFMIGLGEMGFEVRPRLLILIFVIPFVDFEVIRIGVLDGNVGGCEDGRGRDGITGSGRILADFFNFVEIGNDGGGWIVRFIDPLGVHPQVVWGLIAAGVVQVLEHLIDGDIGVPDEVVTEFEKVVFVECF